MAGCGGSPNATQQSNPTKVAPTTISVPISVLLAQTPGATNPAITQATVASTICNPRRIPTVVATDRSLWPGNPERRTVGGPSMAGAVL